MRGADTRPTGSRRPQAPGAQTHWRLRQKLWFRRCRHSSAPAAPDRTGVGTQLTLLQERPPPRAAVPSRFSSLVTAVTPRRAHLPRPFRRDRHPCTCTHTLTPRCPHACAITLSHHNNALSKL